METPENSRSVRADKRIVLMVILLTSPCDRRSQHFQGARRNAWDQRMDKTKKEQAVKKLEAQLKDEKHAEITRLVPSHLVSFLDLIFDEQETRDYEGTEKGGRRASKAGGE